MQALFNHIAHIKTKPHHIRKQVAFTYALIGTGVITLVWLSGSLATGAFAIRNTDENVSPSVTTSAAQGLAGAAAALQNNASAPAQIQIIDTTTTSSKKKADPTTLPF